MRRKIYLLMAVLSMMLLCNNLSVEAQDWSEAECTGYGVLLDEAVAYDYENIDYSVEDLTPENIYNRMIALKADYPEGMPWTNDNFYAWKGGIYSGGYGCAGFAFLLSDAAFDDLPARILDENNFASIRVGDILRINYNTHSVIVLEVHSDHVIIAEGNYNRSIHWGRKLTKSDLESGTLTYIMTRYPEGYNYVLVEDIVISEAETLCVTETKQLTATVYPSNATDSSLSWNSSNVAVATVDATGLVTAVSPGTAVVTVTALDGSGVSATCTVTVLQKVNKINLSDTKLAMNVSDTYTLVAEVLPANASNKEVGWQSSNTSVATVDVNGKITAVAPGTATITVTAKDGSGISATCTVTVSQPVEQIELSEKTLDLFISETHKLVATVTPTNASNKTVLWTSSNETVVTVDQKGNVKAVGVGTATVTATAKDGSGISGSCVVTTSVEEENPFYDVLSSKWYYPFALRAYNEGIMSGVGTDAATGLIKFAPENSIPREQFVQILYNREGKPTVEYSQIFSDVAEQSSTVWYSDAIMWASQNDLVSGYDNGKFGVGDLITREQVAVILKKYAAYKGYDVTVDTDLEDLRASFNDVDEIHDWAQDSMCWAVEYGVMSGKSGGWLSPLGNAQRAEAATMILNMMDAYEK